MILSQSIHSAFFHCSSLDAALRIKGGERELDKGGGAGAMRGVGCVVLMGRGGAGLVRCWLGVRACPRGRVAEVCVSAVVSEREGTRFGLREEKETEQKSIALPDRRNPEQLHQSISEQWKRSPGLGELQFFAIPSTPSIALVPA